MTTKEIMKNKITNAEKKICKIISQLPSEKWLDYCDTRDRLDLFWTEKYQYDLLTRAVVAELDAQDNPIDSQKEPPRFAYAEIEENGNVINEKELKPESPEKWRQISKATNILKEDYLSLYSLIKHFWNEIHQYDEELSFKPTIKDEEFKKVERIKAGDSAAMLGLIFKEESDIRMSCLFPELTTGNYYVEFSLRNYERKNNGDYYDPYQSKLRKFCVQVATASVKNQTVDSMETKKSSIVLENYQIAHGKLLKQCRSVLRGKRSFAVNRGVVVPSKKGGVYGA